MSSQTRIQECSPEQIRILVEDCKSAMLRSGCIMTESCNKLLALAKQKRKALENSLSGSAQACNVVRRYTQFPQNAQLGPKRTIASLEHAIGGCFARSVGKPEGSDCIQLCFCKRVEQLLKCKLS